MSKANYVTASEVGEYTYCPRGWWLHYHGLLETTPQMLAGTKLHDQLGRKVIWFRRLAILSIVLIVVGLVALLILSAFYKF